MEVSFPDRCGFLTRRIFPSVFFVGVVLVLTGCVNILKPPEDILYEDIPEYSWETLLLQHSFNFNYNSYSDVFSFEVRGKGQVVMPDALRFKGTWKLGEEERVLDMAAAGSFQLEKEGGQWVARQRSEETKIIDQVDQVLRYSLLRKKGKGFELVEDEGKVLNYSFTPALAHLDPKFEKEFDAILVIDGRTLLAKEIHVISDDEEVGFDFEISSVNRAKKIGLPFSANFMITYDHEWGSTGKATRGLKKRLKELGRESRIHVRQGEIEVRLALPVDESIARALGEPGQLTILGLNLEGSGPTINKRGEVSDIFHVADTVAWPVVKSVELGFDSLSRPLLETELVKSEPLSRSFDYLGVAVDGVLYEVFAVDNPLDLIRISNVATYQDVLALALKLEKDMRAKMNFVDQKRLR
ncbi:hypothetical protein JXM67_12845 [candidate division WOR-3 bacterium]|nr:hypothetical protein [candidate division WOR-3 bacterium]